MSPNESLSIMCPWLCENKHKRTEDASISLCFRACYEIYHGLYLLNDWFKDEISAVIWISNIFRGTSVCTVYESPGTFRRWSLARLSTSSFIGCTYFIFSQSLHLSYTLRLLLIFLVQNDGQDPSGTLSQITPFLPKVALLWVFQHNNRR